ncbi:hypothetical protein IGI04_019942 [Brassica rapa subsp. trilocularis]|uniref:Serine-threonine/tyrosine-protein kinase catalytic domain-containing protein n=1 Tax=Brassica rapa subsp. trilocularis TaxID=1813537 RepID=A0ABQ7MIZ9_BRACM|nr:hypothetical protein IGI04_019942 [Brassica rapa subsp. trilocularis]
MEHLWQSKRLEEEERTPGGDHQFQTEIRELLILQSWPMTMTLCLLDSEKKLEMLVDPDMHVNYTEAKVEQLIQVALLCTPMQRPMMSDFVRMLEDDGLAEKRDEWQNQVGSGAVLDSTENLHARTITSRTQPRTYRLHQLMENHPNGNGNGGGDGAFPELHNVDANGNAHHNLVQNANVQDNLVQNANVQQNFEAMLQFDENEAMLQHDENEAVQEEEDEDAEMQALIQLIEDTLSEDMIMEHEENIAVVNGEDMIMEHAVIADGVAAEIDGAAVQQENIAEVALVQNEEIQNEGVPNQDDDDVDEAEV